MPIPILRPAEDRVLVLAPTGRDASLAISVLQQDAELKGTACETALELCEAISQGAGLIVVAQEALAPSAMGCLTQVLQDQPPWSDLPVVILTASGDDGLRVKLALEAFGPAANVTLLERPFRSVTFVSVVRGALQSRKRQYQVRHLLEQRTTLLENERAARAEAEIANRMKDEFLASLSHELRTPLNAILGWCQLLRLDKVENQNVRQGLEVIERNAKAQSQMIEDLLDVSRIISGKLRLNIHVVDVTEVIQATLASVLPSANGRGVRIVQSMDGTAVLVSADPERLQQVLWNLLSNAIKFTPKGGEVRVTVTRSGSAVVVSVADTGAGIKPEFLPHVFDRFRQADASTTRKYGGLGLGLAIVRQLTELHGGTAQAESAGEGQGATFTIRLPIAAVRAVEAAMTHQRDGVDSTDHVEANALEGLHVLVVDDDADSLDVLRRVLSEYGALVEIAHSAEDATVQLTKEVPQLLISDVGMPGHDGYELMRQVRSRGLTAQQLPAVALTAFARPVDRERALLAGFQVHISKPVNACELVAAVASLAGRTGA